MLTHILFALGGAFIGWLTPEPQWAKDFVTKVKSKFHIT